MQIVDLRKMRVGSVLTTDICIVGSGPAGLTIATEFAHTGCEVLVVESGSRHREDAFSIALNEVESVGAPRVMDQQKLRNRTLGGTTYTWSGRCIKMDAIDYVARPWVPGSGWPIAADDVVPFLGRAQRYLGVPELADETLIENVDLPQCFDASDRATLRPVFWQFSRDPSVRNDYVRFGPRFAKLDAPNIRVLTNATATHIDTNERGSHVQSLEIASETGAIHHVRSRVFILCGGGIENPRMLLASNRIDPRGVGNARDLVGRYLMDHPRAVLGTFAREAIPAVQAEFGLFHYGASRMQRGLSLSDQVQREEKLLNCAAWTTQHVADDDVWRAMRSMRRAHGRERLALGRVVLKHADQVAAGAWNRFVRGTPLPRRMKHLDLEVMIEQAPDPESRITLADRKDALGVPLARIDWKIGEMERCTAVRLGHAVNEALAHAGLPVASLVDWVRDQRPEDAVFTDPAHPMGATRMAESAAHGVVDQDCRVFGVDNLYIAGSSVFPTGGHANPTLMIVALALRLADTLRQELHGTRNSG